MEFHRGLVRSYDATTHTAAVLLVGSMSRVLLSLPVSHQIGPGLMVEGAACGVAFFAEGSQGVVVCTFDGAPAEWVTTDLIVDGTIDADDLNFSPCTPDGWSAADTDSQTLTTTAAVYKTLTHEVEVPAGKTYRVLMVGTAEMGNTAYTNYNNLLAACYKGSTMWGAQMGFRANAVDTRAVVAVCQQGTITADTTFSIKVWHALDRNTEVCYRGNMTLNWWEET